MLRIILLLNRNKIDNLIMAETRQANKRAHAFTDDVLSDLDGVGIAELIKKKELQPKEVVAASIKRANKVDPHINAVVSNCYNKAFETANNHKAGFFAGVPTYLKDMTLVKGYKTYFGSEAFEKVPPPKKTDKFAKQVFDQGFVHLGNSSMPEFGFTCSTEFPAQADTSNPWNVKHTAGGSSGGAGALVGAGVVPIAFAADGGGSTRIPAACCGAIGLKPTRGRLLKSSAFNVQAVEIAIDGIISRSVRDHAYFYAEAEKYYSNPKLEKIGLVKGPSKKTYNIGYTGEGADGQLADKVTLEALEKTALLLESMGHTVKPIQINVDGQFKEDFVLIWSMNAFFCHRFGKQLFGSKYNTKKLTNLTLGLSDHYFKNILNTPAAIYRLRKSAFDFQNKLKELDIDVLLTPTLAHAPPALGYLGMRLDFDVMFPRMGNWAYMTPYFSANGAPSLSLPMGFDDTNDLPIGMLFSANHGEERLLFDLAYQIEEAQPWRKITNLIVK